jgi:hypothetical protein
MRTPLMSVSALTCLQAAEAAAEAASNVASARAASNNP